MTFPFNIDMKSPEEIAAEDPFGGDGCFFADKESSAEEMFARFFEFFGEMPAVAWEGQGIWLNATGVEGGAAALKERWEEHQRPLAKVQERRAKSKGAGKA
jgi:hypothetical protein